MTIFEIMLLAHIAGDWIFQNEWQALNKSNSWPAMLSHVFVYHLLMLGALVAKLGSGEPVVYVVVASLAVTHTILDKQPTIEWIMRTLRITVNRPPDRWLSIITDQAIHILLLGLAALILSQRIS